MYRQPSTTLQNSTPKRAGQKTESISQEVIYHENSPGLPKDTKSIHFRRFLYLVTCLMKATVSLHARYKLYERYMFIFHNQIIVLGDEIVPHFDRNSNKMVTLRKHVSKNKNMRKWMVEYLRKFENRSIKIARVNSIRIPKSINLLEFYTVLGFL